MKTQFTIPKDLLPYFSEIAKRLWTGHATVMIGAGFSTNAKKSHSTSKGFPSWDQLGDIFYEKLNKTTSSSKKYLNVLKLADEVQAAYGRNTLDHILKTEIPDKEFQPSPLHEKLLKLPWTDVFTTNYDTLLERSAEFVTNQRFDIVLNKEDLVYSAKPRIIKLHGSFPSERPFIITEDDYRRYPKEFAPFVNTVQQSLLENTLCLLGFSGDDPNFLQWIGWIRDNLGKENSPKIYLIGILSLSVAQKKLLEQRNIIPLDLSNCKGINGNYERALSLFIDFLHNEGKVEDNLEWPENNIQVHFEQQQEILPQIIPILENWASQRKKYPNWLIVPEDRRSVLITFTEYNYPFISHLSKIEFSTDILFLYEYNWRIEKCLMPIDNNLIKHYEDIINKYNPFPTLIKIENGITPNIKSKKKLDWSEVSVKWIEIQLSMMRYYREEGLLEKWQLITDRLSIIIEELEPDFKARFYYERCLYYLFALDILEVRKELDLWPVNNSLPYWEAKRAGLLAEIGEVMESVRILENSLKTIRTRLNLSPIVNDYSDVSQEAYIMQLLKYTKNALDLSNRIYRVPKELNKSYTERWNNLVRYKCDPWTELNLFEINLDKEIVEFKESEINYGFDIGSITMTHHLGWVNKNLVKAYSFLRYLEEIGIPFKLYITSLNKKTVNMAIKNIANYSPYWAFSTLVRNGDVNLTDTTYNRKSISSMDSDSINKKVIEYLSILEKSENEIKNGDSFIKTTFGISLSTVIPEVLSRLCDKSSYEVKLKLLAFLKKVYESELKDRYRGIGQLTKRLIKSLSISQQNELIPFLLEFPILTDLHPIIEKEYLDPFHYFEFDININTKIQRTKVNVDKFNNLIEIANKTPNERHAALDRLINLWKLGCLSKYQTKKLGELLWSRTDENTGFPKNTDFHNFLFLNLPHPANIDPAKLLKDYISKSNFPIQANEKGKGVSLSGGDIPLLHEIRGTLNSNISYIWNKEDISLLIKKLIEWWDADKKYLKEQGTSHPFGSIHDEFEARFRYIFSIFPNILSKNHQIIDEPERKEFQRIFDELEKFNIPTTEIKASLSYLLLHTQKEVSVSIFENLFSRLNYKIRDALSSLIVLLDLPPDNVNDLIKIISEHIASRNEIELVSFINTMRIVVKNYPKLINDKILSDLKIGLTYLSLETVIMQEDSYEVVAKKLINKKATATLAVVLERFYTSRKIKIPDYIENWKNLCLDKNEFSGIRKIWENV